MSVSRKNLLSALCLLMIITLFTSCFPEKKIIQRYIENDQDLAFLFLPADIIFKNNLKTYEIEGVEDFSEEQMDSALYANSLFLQFIEDSVFLKNFNEAFFDGLMTYGMDVFKEDQLDSLMNSSASLSIVRIAQVLMEEYVGIHQAEAYILDEVVTSGEIDVNAISVSTWFEINPMNKNDEEHFVLFASDEIADTIYGKFIQYFLSGNIGYEYETDYLQLEDIYQSAAILGRKYAGYLFDYYMNMYIAANMPPGMEPAFLYHYNPEKNRVEFMSEPGFIKME